MATPAFRAASTNTAAVTNSVTVAVPAGTVAGDLLLFTVGSLGGPSPAMPNGWTHIRSLTTASSSPYNSLHTYWKIATSGDLGSNVTFSYSGGTATALVAALIAYQGGTNVVAHAGVTSSVDDSVITAPSVVTTAVDTRTIAVYGASSGGAPTITVSNTARAQVTRFYDGGSYGTSLAVGDDSADPQTTTRNATLSWSTSRRNAITITITGNVAPTAPTLESPIASGYASLHQGGVVDWTFNDPNTGDTQSAYALRRRIGAGAYEYWRASDATWQAAEVQNTSSVTEVTFGAGKWAVGTTYGWSVKTWDAAGLAGPYATDSTVTISNPPVATITYPIGTISDSVSPLVQWTYSDAEGDARDAYQVVVESGAYDTTPGSGTTVENTGVVLSTSLQYQLNAVLNNNTSYRVFVRARQAGNLWSAWDQETFTITLDAPPSPTVQVTQDVDRAIVNVLVRGQLNLLTANQANLEVDTSGWVANVNCAIARSTTQALKGVASLRLTASAAGNMQATNASGAGGRVAVAPGTTYTAIASFRANSTSRTARVYINWFDSADAFISTSTGSDVTSASTGWTKSTVTAAAPANAAYARVVVQVDSAASGEQHFVDAISIAPGTGTEWSRGGLTTASPTIDVQRSVDGGTTWASVRNSSNVAFSDSLRQTVTVVDREAPPNTEVRYRAIQRNFV